jgi:phosphopantothenoylcysteine decarboxylase/phosphopantothenate--cysteine ligase
MFEKRCAVVGVTGGIAAFKAASLVSALKKLGAEVHVIMTKNALEFITPLTFEVLSANPVITDTFDRSAPWEVEHVSLAEKADIFIIAPATANFIGKAAGGIADDMLTTTLLAAKCPVVVAPAMNTNMYTDATVVKNMESLKEKGFYVMGTGYGLLACGDTGEGRMKEPDEIIAYAGEVLKENYDMAGIRVLVTAGPTREKLDPVRFISSPSTGKMGYAIAEDAIKRGAVVTLVSGPVGIKPPVKAETIQVESAAEMYEAVLKHYENAEIVVKSAAVADYRPRTVAAEKIKKGGDMVLELERTEDILKELGRRKAGQVLVGFAAETGDTERYARSKLDEKNLDMIAANDVTEPGAGFAADTNHIVLYRRDGAKADLGLLSKEKTAHRILDEALKLYRAK